MPDPAWHYPADVTEMVIDFNGTCNATRSRLYRRAYYAACAYQDYNIGLILNEIEKLEVVDDTLVVLLGDHVSKRSHDLRLVYNAHLLNMPHTQGWNLGEHDLW